MKRIPQGLALVSAAALAAFGCHALDVQTPDIVPPTSLNDPNALPTLRAGAIGDFEISYDGSGAQGSSGTTEGQVAASGTIADEWINTETFPDRVSADARTVDPSSATYATIFANLARARVSAENAAGRFRALSDTTVNTGLAEMLTLAGLTYVMLAENYCNGVPLDQLNADGSVTHGVQLTTSQILDTAANRFTQALAVAQGLNIPGPSGPAAKTKFVAFASVGLARTLLDQGDAAGASAAASDALAPTSFSYVVEHDLNSFRQQNGVFNGNRNFKRYGVADLKGGVGFPYMSVSDPRTPFFRSPATNLGFDKKTPQFDQLRYVDQKASTTVATGAEARLINAEASLLAGDTVGFMGRLNALRAAPPGYFLVNNPPTPIAPMAALATPTSDTAAVSLLFAERARWLWFTAHRLNDLRRLVRPVGQRGGYGRAVNAVFPNGPYFKNGLVYGNDVNLPVPLTEQNNPNFVQCIDRNP
jgi:hypothetical protein